jgi:hypothetical protein
MTCTCHTAGFCQTFNREMPPRMHDICQGKVLTPEKCEAYRKLWSSIRDGEKKPAAPASPLRVDEARELFGDDDPSLWGNKIAALTKAIGIPPCGGCEKRRQWLNKAHTWLRGQ